MMRNVTADNLTATVLNATAATTEPRLREIMTALVTHLHAFVRETRPSLAEFVRACQFLARAGQISDDKRNEFILIANLLGVEVLIDMLANAGDAQSTVLGPMYRADAPRCAHDESIVRAMPADGEIILIEGRVSDAAGHAIAGATIDVWEPSTNGLYENQDPAQPDLNLRGRFTTDAHGRYAVRCLRPHGYPVPYDGPGGELLRQLGRHPMRPAHVHFMITAPGYRPLVAQLYDSRADHLDNDVIFAVKDSLVAEFSPAAPELGVALHVIQHWTLHASA